MARPTEFATKKFELVAWEVDRIYLGTLAPRSV